MQTKAHPEFDDSPLLDIDGITHYQHTIGVGQWLIVAGRFDINYAISLLSRFASAPREERRTFRISSESVWIFKEVS